MIIASSRLADDSTAEIARLIPDLIRPPVIGIAAGHDLEPSVLFSFIGVEHRAHDGEGQVLVAMDPQQARDLGMGETQDVLIFWPLT